MTQILDCPPQERKPSIVDLSAVKARQQATWASGDFAVIGTTLQLVGDTLCEAVDVLSLRAVRVEVRTLLTLQAFIRPGGLLFLFRGASGPDSPEVVPPLRWTGTFPLVESLQSRLTLLQKIL